MLVFKMNKQFDICLKCRFFQYIDHDDKRNSNWIGWEGECKKYGIRRMENSESCEKLEPVQMLDETELLE